MSRSALAARIEEVLANYDWCGPVQVMEEESGMNNTTRVLIHGEQRYVLRIYNNHSHPAKVALEHEALAALQRQELGLAIPQPILSRGQKTFIQISDGNLAAIYQYIEGNRPKMSNRRHVSRLGTAAGRLSHALMKTEISLKAAYSAYYELEQNYAHLHEPLLQELFSEPHLVSYVNDYEKLRGKRRELIVLCPAMARLPRQWIHGDIVFNNAVAVGDEIIGLLDFEFVTKDLRAMELAVVLPEFIRADEAETEIIENLRLFTAGFLSQVQLNQEELHYLPDLMMLRMVDVHLHFADRLLQGLDAPEIWADQLRRTSFVCAWIDCRRDMLHELFVLCSC